MNLTQIIAASAVTLLSTSAASGPTITAGLYKVTTKSSLQKSPITEESCVSPAKAAKGGIGLDEGASCRWIRSVRAGGKLDMIADCGRGAKIAIKGSYTPTSYDYVLTTAGGPLGAVTAQVRGQRVGATCTADDD